MDFGNLKKGDKLIAIMPEEYGINGSDTRVKWEEFEFDHYDEYHPKSQFWINGKGNIPQVSVQTATGSLYMLVGFVISPKEFDAFKASLNYIRIENERNNKRGTREQNIHDDVYWGVGKKI